MFAVAWIVVTAFTPPEAPAQDAAAAEAKKAVVAALVEALKDSNEQVRIYAESALTRLDTDAVPALIELLGGKDQVLRARAAKILGSMGTHGWRHQEALPALTKALKDGDDEVRRAAAHAISQIVVPTKPR